MRISNILLMVIFPTAALAEWETNMPRGVTPTSEVAYDLHMLIFYIIYSHINNVFISVFV